MNLNRPVQNPFLQQIENPILKKSQLSELYTILSQGKGYLDVFGECGTGKTTMLRSLGKIDVKAVEGLGKFDNLVCIHIDCKTKVTSESPEKIPEKFWQVIFEELEKKSLNIDNLDRFERSNKGLEMILEKLAHQSKHLFLVLDEFEGLIPGEDSLHQQTRNFLTELRGLTNHEPSVILAVGTRCGLEKLWEPFANPGGSSEFPNNSTRFLLGLWQEAQFQAFLERSKVDNQRMFSPEQMRFIEKLSGRHPGLTQKAAKLLFNKRLDENTHNLTDLNLREITKQFITEAASIYREIWKGMDEEERLVMTIIVLENNQGEIPNARYSIKNINQSLDQRIVNDLKGRHLLVEKDINPLMYKPFSPFFNEWIVQEIAKEPPNALQERLKLYGGRISQGNAKALKTAVSFLYRNKDVIVEYTKKIIQLAIDLIN